MSKLKLVDYIKINPDPSYADLSSKEKVNIVDSLLNRREGKRGLYVTYDLSHSGRRINNRIYTVAGQRAGIDTLLSPYPKPIIKNHDDHDDPIGRFVDGVWDDTSSEALAFFDDVNDFMSVQSAFDADDPERIYASMKRHGLLTRKKWPGLGRMRVTARISDQDSIEKFLDGRYITFSAGSTTDRHVCSICSTDWAKGEVCEHRHGRVYDKDLCVFVTGKFEVLEGSVVNMPADDLSQVLSMELADSVRIEDLSAIKVDKHTVYLTDSKYNVSEKNMSEKIDDTVEAEVLVEDSEVLSSEENTIEEAGVETPVEVSDEVETSEETEVEETEVEVALDSKDTESTDESSDSITFDDANKAHYEKMIEAFTDRVLEAVRKELNLNEVTNGSMENNNDASAEEKEEEKEALNIDKAEDGKTEEGTKAERVLEEVVNFDKPLTTEERNKLKASTFCGPERSYPVPDKSHAVAALSRAKQHASPELYKKIKSCVCRKSDKNGWDLPSCNTDEVWSPELTKEALEKESLIMGWDVAEDQELQKDYANALSTIERLEKKLADTLSYLNTNVDRKISLEKEDAELAEMVQWFDSINGADKAEAVAEAPQTVEVVENPSIASTDDITSPRQGTGSKKLGSFEKKVVETYSQLLEKDGLNFAERYLKSKRRYLRRGFHPKNYIQLGD